MTVSAQTLAFEYASNGVTTTFPYGFRVLYADQVKVYVNGTLQVGGYTLTGVGDAGGGNVIFSVAPVNGSTVLVRRISDRVRSTDFQQAPYFTQEELLDLDQDYQTMLLQEAAGEAENSIRIPATESSDLELPSAAARANKALVFDALGNVSVSADDYNDQAADAAASAAAAAASEQATTALYDEFDDRYLGSKASDPALDNDGDALEEGAIYWNSTLKILKIYNASAWVAFPANTAVEVAFTPSGSIAATNTQAAIEELDTEKLSKTGGTITGSLTVTALSSALNQRATSSGSATNASLQVVDANNGLFAPATNAIGLAVNGAERHRVDSGANFSRVIPGGSTLYPDFACRAWANLNGTGATGSQTIRASGNFTSIAKLSTGYYRANFATPMPDQNYCAEVGQSADGSIRADAHIFSTNAFALSAPSAASFVFALTSNTGTNVDSTYINISVFR